jgi:hypothetical protein
MQAAREDVDERLVAVWDRLRLPLHAAIADGWSGITQMVRDMDIAADMLTEPLSGWPDDQAEISNEQADGRLPVDRI